MQLFKKISSFHGVTVSGVTAVLLLAGCMASKPQDTEMAVDIEGVPMVVRVEGSPEAGAITVIVRETTAPTVARTSSLYQLAANKVMAQKCGPVLSPELVSEASQQGIVGRDFVFKCAPGRLDRSRPQSLQP